MKQILLLMALSAFTLPAVAQTTEDNESVALEQILKLELGLQGGGLGYELPLGNKFERGPRRRALHRKIKLREWFL